MTAPTAPTAAQVNTAAQLDRAAVAAMAGYSSAGTVTTLLSRARQRRAELERAVQAGEKVRREQWAGLFPEPDGHLGRTPFWYEATVRRYLTQRSEPGQPSMHGKHQADVGPGTCPVCGKTCYGSVASHRQRRAACSYDSKVRRAAADYAQKWLVEKAEQNQPGNCPVCGRYCETSVTAHRNGRQECSFDPVMRAAAGR